MANNTQSNTSRKLVGLLGFLLLLFLGYSEYNYLTKRGANGSWGATSGQKPKRSPSTDSYGHTPQQRVPSSGKLTGKKSTGTKCSEHKNIVFIKTHKTGAHIVTNILQRYGETNDLNFVLPKSSPYEDHDSDTLGWPDHFNEAHMEHLELGSEPFNILCNYARYSKDIAQIMPDNTEYFTILSDPASQTFLMYQALGLNSKDYGISFDDFINKYQYMLTRYRGGEPISLLTRNSQAFDLGFDNELKPAGNTSQLSDITKAIEQQFALVLISEYLDESLVLLARQLCWSLEHVVFLPLWVFKPDTSLVSEFLKQRARQHSNIDWALYTHFNKTLWRKIEEYGPDFHEDLEILRYKIDLATKLCIEPAKMVNKVHIEGIDLDSVEMTNHNLVLKTNLKQKTYDYCTKMVLNNKGYTDRIRRQHQIKTDVG